MAKVAVIGGNFAGLTGALEAKRKLGKEHEVILISKTDKFAFIPSLIWVPFGLRKVEDVLVPLKPVLDKKGVRFLHAEVTKVDPEKQVIETTKGEEKYDYLLIASGVDIRFDLFEGIGPHGGYTKSVCTPQHAIEATEAFEKFVTDPGPVVIGATPGASCLGAGYEFLFNFEKAVRRRGIRKKVDITWITPEPFLGHFGIDGLLGANTLFKSFMKMLNINYIVSAQLERAEPNRIIMKDGTVLPFKYSMIIPPFNGAKFVKNSAGLGDEKGFIPVHDTYQHKQFKNIFAAGLAVQLPAPYTTPVPIGVPKTGYPSDESAKVAATNIVSMIKGGKPSHEKPMGKLPGMCILDAGGKEVLLFTNSLLKPRKFAILIPVPFANLSKKMFEKYFLWKTKGGKSYLP